MLVRAVALILGLSVLFYCLFAGADFGAGILELFRGKTKRREQDEVISRAIAPVWEANHIWIILTVVILFNGFPRAFSEICIRFHIPLLIMLLGIILRGCAFTFRRYDVGTGPFQKYYFIIFTISSFLTPLMLGVIAGGLFFDQGNLDSASFYATYISPWLNPFCFSVGVFVCALFSFLAAVYLIGESQDEVLKKIFSKRAVVANFVVVFTGAIVFICAELSGFPLLRLFYGNTTSLICAGVATVTLLPLWLALRQGQVLASRFLAAGQFCFVFLGWYSLQYPVILIQKAKEPLTIFNTQAPEASLRLLFLSLIFGMLLIFPALFYLLKIFKGRSEFTIKTGS